MVQTWPNSSGSKGNSWGLGGGNGVQKEIVSSPSKELWGISALERLGPPWPALPRVLRSSRATWEVSPRKEAVTNVSAAPPFPKIGCRPLTGLDDDTPV